MNSRYVDDKIKSRTAAALVKIYYREKSISIYKQDSYEQEVYR